jgi:hypothetical protein
LRVVCGDCNLSCVCRDEAAVDVDEVVKHSLRRLAVDDDAESMESCFDGGEIRAAACGKGKSKVSPSR